jgi:hypothetical protein
MTPTILEVFRLDHKIAPVTVLPLVSELPLLVRLLRLEPRLPAMETHVRLKQQLMLSRVPAGWPHFFTNLSSTNGAQELASDLLQRMDGSISSSTMPATSLRCSLFRAAFVCLYTLLQRVELQNLQRRLPKNGRRRGFR